MELAWSLLDLCKDHPELVQKVTKLLVELVKRNPDLPESSWQHTTASIVPAMMLINAGSVQSSPARSTVAFCISQIPLR